MLAELDVVVFIKSNDDLDRLAQRLFGKLRSHYETKESPDWNGAFCEAAGLGFSAVLFTHGGDLRDPEFEDYQYGLELTNHFWCVELDAIDIEGPLSEYYARQLAFELDLETGTEFLVDTTEESEIYEIRSYRRNSQYRLDQSPTAPKVFVIERRQVAEPFDFTSDGAADAETDEDQE